MAAWSRTGTNALIAIALAALTAALFAQVAGFDYVNYDDPYYVQDNLIVQRGLTGYGVKWAFTTTTLGNWHPLTWLSYMLDCELFGAAPGAHHLVNVLFHALSAILLFLALERMTQAPWRSAFVAALFALHPLRVGYEWWSDQHPLAATIAEARRYGLAVKMVTGDNLAIAKEIVAAHSGTIACESTPEHTVFTIALPAA